MVNTTAAIMALPAPMENVRLVGDEEKHATLLFFGETSTLPGDAKQNLLNAVQMATSLVFPFSESINGVVRLGSDNPPALVAMLSNDCIGQLRNLFMMNVDVETYLGNTPQFPSFTPHVTLAHPDFADEAIIRTLMRSVYRVRFDRLAVWWNDERIEFPITGPPIPQDSQDSPSLAMSSLIEKIVAENTIEHSGVKGMKWGVRKEGTDANNHSVFIATGAKPKMGQQFESGGQTHVVNRAVTRADGKHVITTQTQAKAKLGEKLAGNIKKDKEYWHKQAAIYGVVGAGLAAAALAPALVPASVLAGAGGAAVVSGKITLGVGIAARGAYVHNYMKWHGRQKAQKAVAAHADMNETRTVGEVYDQLAPNKKLAANLLVAAFSKGEDVTDDSDIQNGWAEMTPIERSSVLFFASAAIPPRSAISHSELMALVEVDAEDAEQSGVKGMKWGIRRAVDPSSGLAKGIPPGLKLRTGSADQIHQDRIQKKIDTVGIHSLSSAEIKSYTARLQLEKDVKAALAAQSAQTQAKADGFIKRFVKKQVTRQTDRVVDKAIDVAMEQAVLATGLKIHKNSKGFDPKEKLPEPLTLGKGLIETSKRMAPKKK